MPVTTPNQAYDAKFPQWQRCRDAAEGSDAVKARGALYLPKLSEQSDQEYNAYKMRALWYGATMRTVQGLTGAVTRKDPKFTVPDAMVTHLEDLTLTGVSAVGLAKDTLGELLITGRCGMLIDYSNSEARPYWVLYTAEQILNWRTEMQDGVERLVLVVLRGSVETIDPDDEFVCKTTPQYRVLSLEDGQYMVRLFTPKPDKPDEFDVEELPPTLREEPLKEIPFCFFSTTGLCVEPEKGPLLDLVDVNLSHYRSSADLEHGRHFCGLPTPWVAGFPADTKLAIGSSVAWVASDPQASAGMLEFTGQGLGALEHALESKEKMMAVLGARMLEEQKIAAEASETLKLRSTGERSVLQSMAVTIATGWTWLLRRHAGWMGIKAQDKIVAELNTDFLPIAMTGPDLQSLVQAWQANAISYDTFYWNLQRGELARPGISTEDERTLIQIQQPDLSLSSTDPALAQL